MTSSRKQQQTAFVLAGGGSLGAVQVGMLKALIQNSVTPDFVVGASVGAINGAFFAGRPTLEGVMELEKIWLRIRQKDVFPITIGSAITLLLTRRNYLVNPASLSKLITSLIPFHDFKESVLPFHAMATDIY